MGIIAAVTPRVTSTKLAPKIDLSSKNITDIGSISLHQKLHGSLKYEILPPFNANDTTNIFNILWKSAWVLKPQRLMWNGLMQMVHNGERPGESSVIFIPMIDMKLSDESCILSTMHFVTEQAKHYNMSPTLVHLTSLCIGKELKYN